MEILLGTVFLVLFISWAIVNLDNYITFVEEWERRAGK